VTEAAGAANSPACQSQKGKNMKTAFAVILTISVMLNINTYFPCALAPHAQNPAAASGIEMAAQMPSEAPPAFNRLLKNMIRGAR
jgi:hypothetical protein